MINFEIRILDCEESVEDIAGALNACGIPTTTEYEKDSSIFVSVDNIDRAVSFLNMLGYVTDEDEIEVSDIDY